VGAAGFAAKEPVCHLSERLERFVWEKEEWEQKEEK
jgi:hypothetical protein